LCIQKFQAHPTIGPTKLGFVGFLGQKETPFKIHLNNVVFGKLIF
jgi:hypothetical protein